MPDPIYSTVIGFGIFFNKGKIMATISACLIVRNEENHIKKCLESMLTIPIDEYIIVDTGSTDNTKEIVKTFLETCLSENNISSKLFDFKWIDDFAAARNFSFSKATSDYIFWIDADDIVPEETCKIIREYVENPGETDYLMLPYIYAKDEYGTPTLVLKRERVLKRSKNLKWHDLIHEYIDLADMVGHFINAPIIHERTGEDAAKDGRRNIIIYEKAIADNHEMMNVPRFNLYYGAALESDGRDIEALPQYTEFLRKSGPCDECVQAMCSIARIYLNKGLFEQCRSMCFKIMEQDGRFAEPFYYMGLTYILKELYADAIKWFKCAEMMNKPDVHIPVSAADYSINPKAKLEICYWKCNNFQQAMHYCIECLRLRENDAGLRIDYKNLYAMLKKKDTIAFNLPSNINNLLNWSSFRNRRFRVGNYLKAHTHYKVVFAEDYCDALEQCPSIIVWSHFGQEVKSLMTLASDAGIINIYDATESLFEFDYFVDCLKLMDWVFCSSPLLVEQMNGYNIVKTSLFSDSLEEQIC